MMRKRECKTSSAISVSILIRNQAHRFSSLHSTCWSQFRFLTIFATLLTLPSTRWNWSQRWKLNQIWIAKKRDWTIYSPLWLMIPVHYSKANYPSMPPQTGTNGPKSRKYWTVSVNHFQIMIRPFFYIVSSKDSALMYISASGKTPKQEREKHGLLKPENTWQLKIRSSSQLLISKTPTSSWEMCLRSRKKRPKSSVTSNLHKRGLLSPQIRSSARISDAQSWWDQPWSTGPISLRSQLQIKVERWRIIKLTAFSTSQNSIWTYSNIRCSAGTTSIIILPTTKTGSK